MPDDDALKADLDELDRRDMARLVRGEELALNELMARHGTRLFQYLTRHFGSEAEAADCVQEAFVRVYLNRAKFRPSAKFSTWLYTIAMNRARNMRRSHHGEISLDDDTHGVAASESMADPAPNAAEQIQLREQTEEIRRAVLALPEELRAPLLLFEYENLPQIEIAEILGCSRKAVEVRIYRARQLLRKALLPAKQLAL